MSLRILHLTPYYAPAYAFGGVVRALEGLAEAQVSAGHKVRIVTSDAASATEPQRLRPRETLNGVVVYRVRNRWPQLRRWLNLSSPSGLGESLEALIAESDVIHCHEFRTVENWILNRCLNHVKKPIPVVLSPHGTLTYSTGRRLAKRFWDAALGVRIANLYDHVVCLTPDECDQVQNLWRSLGHIPITTSVIPNGIQPEIFSNDDRASLRSRFRERLKIDQKPTLLYMGRLHRRKGVSLLAQAIQQLDEIDIQLLIAGPDEGEGKQLRDLSDERIKLLGYLDGEDRLAALAAADGFVLPAVGEGLSMALLEAMAAGLPAIITPGCHMPEIIEYGAGWLVQPEIESLQNGISDWLAARDEWNQMSAAGKQLVREKYSWERVVSELTTVYRDLIARISSAARS